MRILVVTPLEASQAGGPAQYAKMLSEAFSEQGHYTEVLAFSPYMKYRSGIRHIRFFFQALKQIQNMDAVIVLDTFSVALPTVLACAFRKKQVVVRTGGDFVWEHYVNRTGEKVLLSEFYTKKLSLNLKERIIIWLQRNIVVRFTSVFVFSTAWQRNIWKEVYKRKQTKVCIIENAYAQDGDISERKNVSQNVLWIGRDIPLKNVETLESAVDSLKEEFKEMTLKTYPNVAHEELPQVLSDARVLVIPSVSEVSPNIVFKAFAYGVPVILTNDCGLHHVLDGVVTWIDSRSVSSIETALRNHFDEEVYLHLVEKVRDFNIQRTYTDVAMSFINVLS